jgi:hypothetical protein
MRSAKQFIRQRMALRESAAATIPSCDYTTLAADLSEQEKWMMIQQFADAVMATTEGEVILLAVSYRRQQG